MPVCGRNKCDTMDSNSKGHSLKNDLEDTVSEMEKRYGTLANRRHYLTEKILNMEKTMPMLVAYKLLNSGRDNFPLEKIQEFVDKLSPYPHPNPTEKLLKQTQDKLHNLMEETKQLHVDRFNRKLFRLPTGHIPLPPSVRKWNIIHLDQEKGNPDKIRCPSEAKTCPDCLIHVNEIIETDVKLEETEMELDSLLSVNDELNEKLKSAETQAAEKSKKPSKFPDFKEIHPDDLVYLGKLRQLVQQEIRFKNCIKALEKRENHLHLQLNQLLVANETKKNDRNNVKDQIRRNKKKSRGCNDRPKVTYKDHSDRNDGICHCGSETSLDQDNYSTDVDSRFTDDESSNEEYWECCNCEN